jgi:hypothetical protein
LPEEGPEPTAVSDPESGSGGYPPLIELDPKAQGTSGLVLRAQALPKPKPLFGSKHHAARLEIQRRFLPPVSALNRRGGFVAQSVATPTGEPSIVVGVGLGEKMVEGRATGDRAVVIFVTKKLAESRLPADVLIPAEIGGVPTDLVETGLFRPYGGFQARERPALCGSTVGRFLANGVGETGTIGGLVQLDSGKLALLSNNHVLAAFNQGQVGDRIIQPGPSDGGTDPDDQIALLERYITLDFSGGDNTVDCAAAWTRFEKVSPNFHTFTLDPDPLGTDNLVNQPVRKEGRTTGLTVGQVYTTNLAFNMPYDTDGDGVPDQWAAFVDQIGIKSTQSGPFGVIPFSDEGDSGSLVVHGTTFQPVGLLFAGDKQSGISTANPIQAVIDKLRIQRFIAQVES